MKRVMEGETYGAWSVRQEANGTWAMADCVCQCGTERFVQVRNLRNGRSGSCGCVKRVVAADAQRTHGMSETRAYTAWCCMKARCNNPHSSDYPRYGGRGIRVCERWEDFAAFYADMGDPPKGRSLDRYPDVNGNYEPANCRWATPTEQARNRRSSLQWRVHGVTYDSSKEASAALGVSSTTVEDRCHGRRRADGRRGPPMEGYEVVAR